MKRDVYHEQYRLQLLCGGEWLDNNTPINEQNLNDYLKLCLRDGRRRVVRQTTTVEFSEEVISDGPISAAPQPAAAVAAAGGTGE